MSPEDVLEAHCNSWDPGRQSHTTLRVHRERLPEIWRQNPPLMAGGERISRGTIREISRGPVPALDTMVPSIGKWAALVLEADADDARAALEPLLRHRQARGEAFAAPGETPGLIVIGRPVGRMLSAWISRMKRAVGPSWELPRYLLLVGGPDRIPLEVQSLLDQYYVTGRLDVAEAAEHPLSWAACARYARKVVRYESGELPIARKGLVYSFATDRPTEDSHRDLALPLVAHLRARAESQTQAGIQPPELLLQDDATSARLQDALRVQPAPALVFTVTHGLEFPPNVADWGALTDAQHGRSPTARPLSAMALPGDGAMGDGAVIFSFACFSAGVPQRSAHRFFTQESEEDLVTASFVSALPRVLLARAQGPVAFVGHVDRTTSSVFTDEFVREGYQPYRDFADWLLTGQGTLGQGLSSLRECQGRAALNLAYQHGGAYLLRKTPPAVEAAWKDWLRFYDYGGFMLLGDPALSARTARFG